MQENNCEIFLAWLKSLQTGCRVKLVDIGGQKDYGLSGTIYTNNIFSDSVWPAS